MTRDDAPVAVNHGLFPCRVAQLGLFALTAKSEIRKVFQLVEPKFGANLSSHPLDDFQQAIPLACLIGKDHAEVNCRMFGPVVPHSHANVHDIGGKLTRDSVDLFLSGKGGDHKAPLLKDTLWERLFIEILGCSCRRATIPKQRADLHQLSLADVTEGSRRAQSENLCRA